MMILFFSRRPGQEADFSQRQFKNADATQARSPSANGAKFSAKQNKGRLSANSLIDLTNSTEMAQVSGRPEANATASASLH